MQRSAYLKINYNLFVSIALYSVIEEGNWLSLKDSQIDFPDKGFDAIICMGNSFAHLPDFDGDQSSHRTAITNFRDCLRPGGILVIDHRNYDHICGGGKAPMRNIYYQVILYLTYYFKGNYVLYLSALAHRWSIQGI